MSGFQLLAISIFWIIAALGLVKKQPTRPISHRLQY